MNLYVIIYLSVLWLLSLNKNAISFQKRKFEGLLNFSVLEQFMFNKYYLFEIVSEDLWNKCIM